MGVVERSTVIVYDLSTQPLSIGDFITYMEMGELLGDRDLAYLYNPDNPTLGDPALSHINRHNFQEHFRPFMSLCDKVFTSEPAYDWPPPSLRKEYVFYHVYNNIFRKGVKPIRFKSADWAEKFMAEHKVKFCVQLRNNRHPQNARRNSNYAAWKQFFKRTNRRFLLIGETDDECRMDNTIIAKDYGTTIEQDLALAQAADVFMGPPSGPSGAVIFNDKPYRLFNMTLSPQRCSAYKIDSGRDGRGGFVWRKKNQDTLTGPENVEIIEMEFAQCLA